MLAAVWWLTFYNLELSSAALGQATLWDQVQFIGICYIPTACLVFAIRYVGSTAWVTWWKVVLFSLIPAAALVLAMTNGAHELIWSNEWLETNGKYVVKVETIGPALWVFLVYSYVQVVASVAVILSLLVRSGRIVRWQSTVMFLAISIPAMLDVVTRAFDLNPFPNLDTTPLALCLVVPIVALMMTRLRRLDVMPVARDLVLREMADFVIVVTSDGIVADTNKSARRLLGRRDGEMLGSPVEEIIPSGGLLVKAAPGQEIRVEVATVSGPRIFDARRTPLQAPRLDTPYHAIVLRDVTAQARSEERLQASLKEKEVLLKELHHRVKNNMQIVSSLLNLHMRGDLDPKLAAAYDDVRVRVRAISLVHEVLYRSGDLGSVTFREYGEELARLLSVTYAKPSVRVTVEADEAELPVDAAVPCGLVVSELVTNSLKHAFPGDAAGSVVIRSREEDGAFVVRVHDDGCGFDGGAEKSGSLGLKLVGELVDQLKGTISRETGAGTRFCVTVPLPTEE